MSLFRSKEAETIEQVRAKLDRAKEGVRNAQFALDDLALDAALSDDISFAAEAGARLRQAREYEALLTKALAVAEAREEQRIASAKADLRAVQNKAIRQHIAGLVKEAMTYQAGIDNATAAYRRMVEAGAKIQKLLPRDNSGFADAVSVHQLKQACALYYAKHAARPGVGDENPELDPPGCLHTPAPLPSGVTYARDLPPLSERLKTLLMRQYDRLTGRDAPPAASPELEAIDPRPLPPAPAAEPVPVLTDEIIATHGKGVMAPKGAAAAALMGV
jgi:hypothetical protein